VLLAAAVKAAGMAAGMVVEVMMAAVKLTALGMAAGGEAAVGHESLQPGSEVVAQAVLTCSAASQAALSAIAVPSAMVVPVVAKLDQSLAS
jgi:hypothetical protein